MARKSADIAQFKLRIREDLRRRLEQAAKKRGVSLNYEMTSRLNESFGNEGKRTQEEITQDIKKNWAKWGKALFDKELSGDLVRASEALVELLANTASDKAAIKKASDQVQKSLNTIKLSGEAFARGIRRDNEESSDD